ncbi:DUF805 domain-containing protein [Wukongibacter baidiensis]|uniref:DUF805 domain-containing protein n=1 Tax=Wukongibacter baidiensis TaxID=1723361 RepID=UPI003D7FA1CC
MDIKRYFSFEGRINRARYFLIPLLVGIVAIPLRLTAIYTESMLLVMVNFLVSLVIFALQLCVTIQRLHDIERPGIHYLFLLIPLYNIYFALVLLFKKGTDGPNEYGEDPLGLSYE